MTNVSSRVTIIDRANLFVTQSCGDFAGTLLEEIVSEHIPAYSHNPPIIVVLEDVSNYGDRPLLEPTRLATAVAHALHNELEHIDANQGDE